MSAVIDRTTVTSPATTAAPVVLETRVITGTGGGPDKTILNTPRFLDPFGYRTLCAFLHPPGDPGFEAVRRRAEQAGAPILSVPDRGPLDMRVIRSLVELCRRHQVAIWHGHDYKSNALGLIVRRFHPMRLVTTVHGWALTTRRAEFYYRIDRWCLRRYEHVFCVSPELFDECRRCGVRPERSTLLENGIDLAQSTPTHTPEEAKRRLGLPPSRPLIAAVGRLSDEKNFPLLIGAVHRLAARGLDVGLAIAGDGPEKTSLQRLIDESRLHDRVRLLGFLAEPRTLYEASDVVALSSDREGLPNVLLEAMAFRCPVVSTAVGGVPRLIEHDRNGLLVPPQNEGALIDALGRLLSDAALREHIAAAGRAHVEEHYSFEARMRRIVALYESLGVCGANVASLQTPPALCQW